MTVETEEYYSYIRLLEPKVRQTVYSLAAGLSLATPTSVRRVLLALAMAQPSRTAPTASTASRTVASAECVYFRVVAGWP